jgi:hypothetical protein|nr:MAG TPA: hypothetical protein [Bacteriophage sp.]
MKVIVSKMFLEEQPYYIYCEGEIFQLRLKENHYVMATSLSEADILEKVKLLFQKYNTPVMLQEALRDTDMRIAEAERNRRKGQYKEAGDKYENEILQMVKSMTQQKLGIKKKKKGIKFKLKNK